MLLSGLNSFSANTTILSSAVNANFTAIAAWANGDIQQDNLGVFADAINWSISGSNALALSIASASTAGMIIGSLTGVLASTKSMLDLQSSVAQTTGRALAYLNLSNSGSSLPVLNLANAGTGPALQIDDTGTGTSLFTMNSTKKGFLPPRMTSTQRNAIATPPEGLSIYNTTTHQRETYNGTAWKAFAGGATDVDGTTITVSGGALQVTVLPSGTILPYGGSSAPTLYLLCDGSAVSRATYAALFAVVGTTFGAGDGSTTFNLPDFRRRVPMGAGGSGTSTVGNAVGNTGGEENHTLTINEMPSHNHAPTSANFLINQHSAGDYAAGSTAAASITTTANTGGGASHNNIQPSIVVNYIIKT